MNRNDSARSSSTSFQRLSERTGASSRSWRNTGGDSSSSRSSRREQFLDEYQRDSSRRSDLEGALTTAQQQQQQQPADYYKKYGANGDGDEPQDVEEIYIVRQEYGYLSIFFSVVQTIILGLMMWQCGLAPMNINPMIGPYPDALSEWGGKNSILILQDDQWYRLVTPILLHAGVIHLLCNVAVQLETGVFFEREWGSARWLIIYLASALGSSVLSVCIMPDAISVGSSGAVMGLFGGKLAEVLMRMCERTDSEQSRIGHQVRKEQCMAVTCSVVLVMAFSFIPYVDWAAHLGGLVSGLVVGICLFAWDMHLIGWQLFWFVAGAALVFVAYSSAITYMYSGAVEASEELYDVCGYYQQQFDDYECQCMREEYLNNLNNGNDEHSGD